MRLPVSYPWVLPTGNNTEFREHIERWSLPGVFHCEFKSDAKPTPVEFHWGAQLNIDGNPRASLCFEKCSRKADLFNGGEPQREGEGGNGRSTEGRNEVFIRLQGTDNISRKRKRDGIAGTIFFSGLIGLLALVAHLVRKDRRFEARHQKNKGDECGNQPPPMSHNKAVHAHNLCPLLSALPRYAVPRHPKWH